MVVESFVTATVGGRAAHTRRGAHANSSETIELEVADHVGTHLHACGSHERTRNQCRLRRTTEETQVLLVLPMQRQWHDDSSGFRGGT